ncbi:MAG: membrane integrity-associated transporter subunit PqiC [Proteobacteria bacterium]|nr:membrane integrity-associated transporter subunit PqiC [Pseudomonadota bacterium]
MKTTKTIAACARHSSAKMAFCLMFAGLLAGCAALPEPPARATVYDFGPGALQAAPARQGAALPPLVLAEVGASAPAEGSNALQYRLAYANAQQLRPYSQARWSQPPAALLQQALRERLGRERIVLYPNQAAVQQPVQGRLPSVLRLQLEEFSQVFTSADASAGVVRLRAVLGDAGVAGETLVAQQVFVAQRPAATADAAGGARALAEASAQLADELAAWVHQQAR